jgi:periplasmic copper chaperone A
MNKLTLAAAAALLATTALTGCTSTTPAADQTQSAIDEKKAAVAIENGWVRVSEYSDHTGGMTGVFATITNNTDTDITLVGGSSDIAPMVEVHEVVMSGGAMTMQKKEGGIVIPAGESVTLEPGGLHVMLMDLKQAILDGDQITLTLDFEGADAQTLTLPAKTSAAGDETYNPEN